MISTVLFVTAATGCYYSRPVAAGLMKIHERVERTIRPIFNRIGDAFDRRAQGPEWERQRKENLRRQERLLSEEMFAQEWNCRSDLKSVIEIYLRFAKIDEKREWFENLRDEDPEIFYPLFLFSWRGVLFSQNHPTPSYLKRGNDQQVWTKVETLRSQFSVLPPADRQMLVRNPIPSSIDSLAVSEDCKEIYRELGRLAIESAQGNEEFYRQFGELINQINQDDPILQPRVSVLPTSLSTDRYEKAIFSGKQKLAEEFAVYKGETEKEFLQIYRKMLSPAAQQAFDRRIKLDPSYTKKIAFSMELRSLMAPGERTPKIESIRQAFHAMDRVDRVYFMRTPVPLNRDKLPEKLRALYEQAEELVVAIPL